MNLERVGDRLYLDVRQLTERDRLALELEAVALDFSWARSGHVTPPSVRWKCLL
jgi:hypothetical protein